MKKLTVFLLTLLITKLDPLGLQKWMPEVGDVTSIRVNANHGNYGSNGETFTVEDAEDIEAILAIVSLSERTDTSVEFVKYIFETP